MISLLLFFVFFTLLGLKVYMMDKNTLDTMNHLPLDNDGTTQQK
jgi:hypothetical protein